jgi:hypothetical protein
MDAVRLWRVLRALLLARPVLACALMLFYAAAAALVLTQHERDAILAPLVLAAFPTAGFFGMASERIVRYSRASAALPLPGHAQAMRHGQTALLVIFLGGPLLVGYALGAPLSYGALLCVPAALGVLLSRYPASILPVWAVLAAAAHFMPGSQQPGAWPIGAWLASPWVRVALIAASAFALYRWLDLPGITERRARGLSLALADARHEHARTRAAASQTLAQHWQRYRLAVDRLVAPLTVDIRRAVISPGVLAIGLGFASGTRWAAVFRGSGIAVLALLIAHPLVRPQTETWVYVCLCALMGMQLISRLEGLLQAWRNHPDEAALLRLAPRWPAARRVRALFCLLQLQCLAGTWVAWALMSAIALALQLVAAKPVVLPITAALAAASTAACAALWAALARRRVGVAGTTSWLSVLIALCCAAGAALWLWGGDLGHVASAVGAALMFAPAALAFAAFLYRPLQFPANRVSRS